MNRAELCMHSTEPCVYSQRSSHSSSVKRLYPPGEPLNRFKAGEIKAKTKQTAVGGDDSTLTTYMASVIFP